MLIRCNLRGCVSNTYATALRGCSSSSNAILGRGQAAMLRRGQAAMLRPITYVDIRVSGIRVLRYTSVTLSKVSCIISLIGRAGDGTSTVIMPRACRTSPPVSCTFVHIPCPSSPGFSVQWYGRCWPVLSLPFEACLQVPKGLPLQESTCARLAKMTTSKS